MLPNNRIQVLRILQVINKSVVVTLLRLLFNLYNIHNNKMPKPDKGQASLKTKFSCELFNISKKKKRENLYNL